MTVKHPLATKPATYALLVATTVARRQQDEIILTEGIESSLHFFARPAIPEAGDQVGQLAELLDPEGRSPVGHHHKRVLGPFTGPTSRQGTQPPVAVMEVDPVLSPVVAVAHKLEGPPDKRVKRMGDLESLHVDRLTRRS